MVDDEPLVLSLCQRILTLGGYNALLMASPQEALRFFQTRAAHAIDLALFDVMMPGMNGIELADQIRTGNPTLKIFLMSGFGPTEIARVVDLNPYGIIWKPFTAKSLLRMIENVLRGSKTIREEIVEAVIRQMLKEAGKAASSKAAAMARGPARDIVATGVKYILVEHGKGILCLTCGRISLSPNDVQQRYCGNCHMSHHE